jgi:hypothetical protein
VFKDPAQELQVDAYSAEDEPGPAPARSCDTGLFDDIPPAIWKVFLTGWATVFGLFVLFFATDRSAAFVIFISCMFAMMAFGLPIAMASQSKRGRQTGRMIQTQSGPLSAWEAGAQIVSIPVAAVIGLIGLILLAK